MKKSILYFLSTLIFWFPASLAFGTDLDISPEFLIASGLTPANSDTNNPGKPGIGFDGVNYLVVSCRENDSSDNIEGVLVSTEGAIVTSFPIAELNPNRGCDDQRGLSVAFDGSNYLVVFSQVTATGFWDIVGARITPVGTVLDGPRGFTIFQDAPFHSAVAFDGTNYLVVSVRFNTTTLHDIIGARVNPDGQVLDEFPVFTAPGGQAFPSIAFGGSNYLVIWSDTRSGSPIGPDADIYGTRVSPEGLVLDPGGIPISTALGIQGFNDITFDGVNYFAVWADQRNNPPVIFDRIIDIYGTRITPDGVLLDGPPDTGGIAISTYPRPQDNPVVSFNGTEYFVAWQMSNFFDPPKGIFAARVSTDGFLIDGPPDAGGVLISEPDTFDSKLVWPNSHFNGNNVLLAWTNNRELGGTFKEVTGVLISHNLLNDKFAPLGPGDVATAFSRTPCGGAAAGTFTITATFTNISADTLSNLLISVQTLTGGNVLCNANGGPGGAGATLIVPLQGDLADGQLSPGESFVVELPVGLQSFNPFTFLVDVLGVEAAP